MHGKGWQTVSADLLWNCPSGLSTSLLQKLQNTVHSTASKRQLKIAEFKKRQLLKWDKIADFNNQTKPATIKMQKTPIVT